MPCPYKSLREGEQLTVGVVLPLSSSNPKRNSLDKVRFPKCVAPLDARLTEPY